MIIKYSIKGLLIGLIIGIILAASGFISGRGGLHPIYTIENLSVYWKTLLYYIVIPPAIFGFIIGWAYGREQVGKGMK